MNNKQRDERLLEILYKIDDRYKTGDRSHDDIGICRQVMYICSSAEYCYFNDKMKEAIVTWGLFSGSILYPITISPNEKYYYDNPNERQQYSDVASHGTDCDYYENYMELRKQLLAHIIKHLEEEQNEHIGRVGNSNI